MNKDSAILKLMHISGIGSKTLSRILKKLQTNNFPVEEFYNISVNEMMENYGLSKQTAESIKSDSSDSSELLEELWKHEIRILIQSDNDYPEVLCSVLGNEAPPVLFVKGNLKLLIENSVGFCGSRKAAPKSIELVRQAAGQFANTGVNVVSGYAHGIDMAAHIGSLEKNGTTTFVLPLGILNFALKSDLDELINDNNHLVISEFLPKLGWEIHNAMRRNLTVCGLSRAIILVEPGPQGGTFEAGKTALKFNRPLFVIEHDEIADKKPAEYFLKRGALSVTEKSDSQLDLNTVEKAIESSRPATVQQTLF